MLDENPTIKSKCFLYLYIDTRVHSTYAINLIYVDGTNNPKIPTCELFPLKAFPQNPYLNLTINQNPYLLFPIF